MSFVMLFGLFFIWSVCLPCHSSMRNRRLMFFFGGSSLLSWNGVRVGKIFLIERWVTKSVCMLEWDWSCGFFWSGKFTFGGMLSFTIFEINHYFIMKFDWKCKQSMIEIPNKITTVTIVTIARDYAFKIT